MEGGRPIKEDLTYRFQAGYTLIEFCFGMVFLTTLILLTFQCYISIQRQTESEKNIQLLQLEAVQFLQYFEREASCYDRIYPLGDRVIFFHGTDQYTYKLINNTIVRELNGQGYITVCYNVEKLNILSNTSGISIQMTLKKATQSEVMEVFLSNHLAMAGL